MAKPICWRRIWTCPWAMCESLSETCEDPAICRIHWFARSQCLSGAKAGAIWPEHCTHPEAFSLLCFVVVFVVVVFSLLCSADLCNASHQEFWVSLHLKCPLKCPRPTDPLRWIVSLVVICCSWMFLKQAMWVLRRVRKRWPLWPWIFGAPHTKWFMARVWLTHPWQRRNSVALQWSSWESWSGGRRPCPFGHGITSKLSGEATTSRFGSRAGYLHSSVRAESTMIKTGIAPTLCWPVTGLRDLEWFGMLCAHTAVSWRHSLRPCQRASRLRFVSLRIFVIM